MQLPSLYAVKETDERSRYDDHLDLSSLSVFSVNLCLESCCKMWNRLICWSVTSKSVVMAYSV